MDIKPIRTQKDYQTALSEIERLFDAEFGTPESDKLDVLATLVQAYEAEHYPISMPDPIDAIEYHMERLGLTRKDLEKYIGGPSRVSEILNRKRPLTINMIRSLSSGLSIPIDILAQVYEINEPTHKIENTFSSSSGAYIEIMLTNDVDVIETQSQSSLVQALFSKVGNYTSNQTNGSNWQGTSPSPYTVKSSTERTIQND